jgi:hypothetical protein
MKMAVLWIVESCSLLEVNRRFRHPCCLYHQRDDAEVRYHPDKEGSKRPRKFHKTLSDYTVQRPRRQIFSCLWCLFFVF